LRSQVVEPEKCTYKHNAEQRDAVSGYLSPC
jgi:hypothetical protein